MNRSKARIPEMMPVKKWLTTKEACAYLDIGVSTFTGVVLSEGLSISMIGAIKYFRVAELDELLERNICKRQMPRR